MMTQSQEKSWCIIYEASNTQNFSLETMESFKEIIQDDYRAASFSGVVVYKADKVFCLIEGHKKMIYSRLNQIRKDFSHTDITVLYDDAAPFSYFEDFGFLFHFPGSYEFKSLDDFNTSERKAYLVECLASGYVPMLKLKKFLNKTFGLVDTPLNECDQVSRNI